MIAGQPLGDGEQMPYWVEAYLSDRQLESLLERTMWAVVVNKARISSSAHHVALRLHLWTLSKAAAEAWPSIGSLCRDVKLSRNTVRSALKELAGQGWIVVSPRAPEVGNRPTTNLYQLAWPEVDVIDGGKRIVIVKCGAPLKSGGTCSRVAGWGTDLTEGPCVNHGGKRAGGQPLTHDRSTSDPSEGVNHCPPIGQPVTPNDLVSDQPLNEQLSCGQQSLTEAEVRFATDLRAEGRDELEIMQILRSVRERVA